MNTFFFYYLTYFVIQNTQMLQMFMLSFYKAGFHTAWVQVKTRFKGKASLHILPGALSTHQPTLGVSTAGQENKTEMKAEK